jgi:puromycin-sensitive aminopeptidase
MPKQQHVRLSKLVKPLKYNLHIQPDMEAFTFQGEEVIDIALEKPAKQITLHSKELDITDGWWQAGKTKIDILNTTYDVTAETATFTFAKSLPHGKGKLHLHFQGIIQDSLRGFYRSRYTLDGKDLSLLTTQFESTDARRAFPCFDEPAHKAIFEISLQIPNHLHAISNTIGTVSKRVSRLDGYKIVQFAPSPKMSTYLVAYVIGDFEMVQKKTRSQKNKSVNIRVFTTKGKKDQAQFALQVAKRSLEFLNSYFDVPYPMPDLDLIAIPDFSAGGMENWGAITFRESSLLLDEKNTAFTNRQLIAVTVAHELVHQWFGNLVTMEWWTHLWLNESFAAFMADIVLDELFPEWHIWTRFVMDDHANALELDSLQNTHPVEVEVHHPDQISEIFDAISYDKGASVLRMLMHYIGPENFRKGLSYYLKKHSYKNTSTIHLWEAFEKVSGKPIQKFMSKWVTEPGYPIVTLTQIGEGKMMVEQNRFSHSRTADNARWPIAFQMEIGKGLLSEQIVLEQSKKTIAIPAEAKYFKANPNETGFYRTLYSPDLLAQLFEPIKRKELSTIDRFGVIRDLFAMAKAGHVSTTAYLEFLQAYRTEDSFIIWTEILSGMDEIYNLFSGRRNDQKKLQKYYRRILQSTVELVGWKQESNETQTRGLLRAVILTSYGLYGDGPTIAKASTLFKNRSKKIIHPDLRTAVYSLAARGAGDKLTEVLIKAYSAETLQEEQRRVGKAMSFTTNKKALLKVLDFYLSPNVRSQDSTLLIAVSLQNSLNRKIVWRWLQQNWSTIQERYHDDHLIIRIVQALNGFTTKEEAAQISHFFKEHPVPIAQRAIKQVLEQINLHDAWLKRDQDCINDVVEL